MTLDNHGTEAQEQEALFHWAALSINIYPELEYMYHVPNGGRRDKKTGAALKREGVKAGVPDVCLPAPRGEYHGLYIEMKVGNNKPTQAQERYLDYLRSQGYATAVCYGWDAAHKIIEEYLR